MRNTAAAVRAQASSPTGKSGPGPLLEELLRLLAIGARLSEPNAGAVLQAAQELYAALAQSVRLMSAEALVSTITAITKLASEDVQFGAWLASGTGGLLGAVTHHLAIPQIVRELTSYQACRLVWALGKLAVLDRPTLTQLLRAIQEPTGPEVAMALGGMARSGLPILRGDADRLVAHARRQLETGQLGARGIANVMWACARLRIGDPALISAVNTSLLEQSTVTALKAQEVANVAWALAILQVRDTALLDALADRAMDRNVLSRLKPQELANVAWAFAKLGVRHNRLLANLAARLCERNVLARLKVQEVSNVAWAFATLKVLDSQLMETLGSWIRLPAGHSNFTAQTAANVAWSYAALGVKDVELMNHVAALALQTHLLSTFKPKEMAMLTWSFTSLGITHPPLIAAAAAHVVGWSSPHCTAQDVAHLAWAMATTHTGDGAALAHLAALAIQPAVLSTASPQALAIIVWAFAKLGMKDEALLEKVARHFMAQGGAAWDSRTMALTLWAYARSSFLHELLMESFATRMVNGLYDALADVDNLLRPTDHPLSPPLANATRPDPSLQDVALMAWAHAVLLRRDTLLFKAIGVYVSTVASQSSCSPAAIASLMWAFAKLDLRHEAMFRALADRALQPELLAALQPREAANVLWAHATLDLPNPLLVAALGARLAAPGALRACKPQEAANTLWAAARLGDPPLGLIEAMASWVEGGDFMLTASGKDVVTTLYAFAFLSRSTGASASSVEAALAQCLLEGGRLQTLGPRSVSLALRALGWAQLRDEAVLDALAQHVLSVGHLSSFPGSAIALTVWGYAALRTPQPRLFEALAIRLQAAEAREDLSPRQRWMTDWAYRSLGLVSPVGLLADPPETRPGPFSSSVSD